MKIKPVQWMMTSKIQSINHLGNYIAYLLQYYNMHCILVDKDLKGRFKNTALGYFWHLLNPLTQIVIYLIIFTVIFGKSIPNYWIYVSTGMFAYSFFSSCCAGGCNIIVNNSNLVTKMTFAKEVLVTSKVTSSFITLLVSYLILVLLIIGTGVGVNISIIYLPVILFILFIFCLGTAFLLSSITVYLRDVANATSIITNCLMFAIPIFYTVDKISSSVFLSAIASVNPMYYFIVCIHDVFYSGVSPNFFNLMMCVIFSIATFIIGLSIFKRLEKGFAERL